MTPLLADMAGPMYVVAGIVALAGVFGALSIAWFGAWLVRRSRPTQKAVEEDVP
jgi:hypothetical protein